MEASPDALVTHNPSTTVRALKDIAFGSIAGMISKIFEHPFDLTKVRLQSQVLDATARFNGPVDCLKKTWVGEGIRGLYRGLPAPIVGAMAENASLFLAYSELQNLIRWASSDNYIGKIQGDATVQPLPLHKLALAAAGAGAITSFLLTPIELVKCKMQVQMLVSRPTPSSSVPTKLPGPLAVLASVIRTTGYRGLWLGHTGTLIRETGGTAAWFSTKEYVAGLLVARRVDTTAVSLPTGPSAKPQLLWWESAVSGACAGAAFNLALFPADSVKSTMQTEEELRPKAPRSASTEKEAVRKPTFVGTFRAMYRAQGIRGLYAGCGVTVARSIPSSAIIFLIYDGLNRRFG